MANPTTNYAFAMPTNTDLVKDLPADFEIFGQAVDTQMKTNADAAIAKSIVDAKGDIIAATAADTVARLAVGANNTVLTADSSTATGLKWATPTSGMNLISKTTLSSTSSVNLNNVFSATYDNYRIIYSGTFAAGATDVEMRLRVSGSDNTSANYYSGRGTTDISGTFASAGQSGADKWFMCSPTDNGGNFSIDMIDPFITRKTRFSGTFVSRNLDRGGYNAGFFDLTTSFDGFSIFFANPCVGTLSVYGYGI